MKQETCGKPGKGLPKQEKSREAEKQQGREKPTRFDYIKKPTDSLAIKSPLYGTQKSPLRYR